jgi:hypothetical protein
MSFMEVSSGVVGVSYPLQCHPERSARSRHRRLLGGDARSPHQCHPERRRAFCAGAEGPASGTKNTLMFALGTCTGPPPLFPAIRPQLLRLRPAGSAQDDSASGVLPHGPLHALPLRTKRSSFDLPLRSPLRDSRLSKLSLVFLQLSPRLRGSARTWPGVPGC